MNREGLRISQNVAAGIAQELRTPVVGIASAAQLIRYRIADDPVMEKNIGRILRESERLNTIIEALLEYGRPEPVHLEPRDPDEIWSSVLSAQRGALESKALLVQHTPAAARALCRLDAAQLAQAFGAALSNAIDAAPEGSDLSIVSMVAGDGWTSRLRNSGDAVSPDILARAFDPLVTTKPGHAGIGLPIARRIIGEHGGTVSLDAGNGGATFTLTLPVARQA
jgi:signal transduction histidine kinase